MDKTPPPVVPRTDIIDAVPFLDCSHGTIDLLIQLGRQRRLLLRPRLLRANQRPHVSNLIEEFPLGRKNFGQRAGFVMQQTGLIGLVRELNPEITHERSV